MGEIDRLTKLLDQCKKTGCTQADLTKLGFSDIKASTVGTTDPNAKVALTEKDKKYLDGKIKFPDCGVNITEECFWLHYKKSGWLDFLSFFCYIPALIGCAIYDEYDYGLCLGNFVYILVDAFSKKIAPPKPSL